MTPIEVLDKNGVFDVQVILANTAYLKDVDITPILAAHGASVVACPAHSEPQGLP